jgi:ribosome biogenesis GTPase
MTGIVYKSTGSWYTVKTKDNQFLECRIKGKFRIKGIKSTNPIAVGDVVDYDLDTSADVTIGVITNTSFVNRLTFLNKRTLSHPILMWSFFW